jgi:DNA invertase Pin-like site-specific DNA recombinase
MALVGYARVSTVDQDLSIQKISLKKAGCIKIFSEKKSATKKEGRTALDNCLQYLREGDTLLVTRIDRLSRSLKDLQNMVYHLKQEGIELKATEQPIDTKTASGKAFLDMLGVFAEFETNLRHERQLEGIAKAKKEGKYKGRKPTAMAKTEQVITLVQEGYSREVVASTLNLGIASVYRILKHYKMTNPNVNIINSHSHKIKDET